MTASLLAPQAGAASVPSPAGYRSSGSSPPKILLLGAGKVGIEFLKQSAAAGRAIAAVSDSKATILLRDGFGAHAAAEWKESGRSLEECGDAASPSLGLLLDLLDADVVIDATPSDAAGAEASLARARAVVARGKRAVFAAKSALRLAPSELLRDAAPGRVGANAALGGTGRRLQTELRELLRCSSIAAAANASTTAVIEGLELGLDFDAAAARARAAGVLEADPELDFRGHDALTKLAIAAGAVFGFALEAAPDAEADVRRLDPDLVRARRARGSTTRLVGRAFRDGAWTLRYEELEAGSPLAVPPHRVAYAYEFGPRRTRVHIGDGVGAAGTARALLADLEPAQAADGGAR